MIITRPTRKQKYEREYRKLEMHPFKTDEEIQLYYQVQAALMLVRWFETNRRPVCEHGLPNCPGCHHEQPYNRRWDIEAEAVQ